MATNIDSLSIELKATDRASKSIEKIQSAVKGLNASGISGFSTALGTLNSRIVNLDTVKMGELATGIRRVSTALSSVKSTNGIDRLAISLKSFQGINLSGAAGISTLAKDLGKLGGKRIAAASSNLPALSKYMSSFVSSMNRAGQVSFDASNLAALAQSVAKLGGKKITTATQNLPQMSIYLTMFIKALNQIGGVSFDASGVANLASAISKLGGKNSQQAISNLPKLTREINNMIASLSRAPQVSAGTTQLLTALGNVAKYSNGAKSAMSQFFNTGNKGNGLFSKLGGGIKNVASAMGKSFVPGMTRGESVLKKISSSIGRFCASMFLIIRGVKTLGSAVESANDYIETYNYFEQSYENLDTSGWRKAGYKSADEYINSFKERSERAFSKMTGYSVDENGDLTNLGTKSLGLNPTDVMNYQAQYTQIANSMGVATDTATKMSDTLVKLGADIASLRNVDFDTAWQNLSSGVLAGQSRVLDKYGINVRTAAMNQKLLELNINTTAQKLGQQDKAILRTIIALDASKGAWGDLARTIDTPANRVRLLKENLQKLSLAMGTIFVQAVAKILPYLNAFVIVLTRGVEAIAKFFNFDLSSLGAGNSKTNADVYSDIADDADDASESIDKASKSQKKFNKQLQGFDELNNLTSSESDSSSGDGDTTSSLSATPQLTAALNDLITKYNSKWNKAWKNMSDNANKMADKIQKALKKAWDTGDGSELGEKFAETLNKGIDKGLKTVGQFEKAMKNLGKILGTSLNGFVKTFNWSGAGELVGKVLKGIVAGFRAFFKSGNFTELGRGLANWVNGFVKSGVIQEAFGTLGAAFRSGIATALGTVRNIKWAEIGTTIGEGINEFFAEMNDTRESGLTGWQELGETLSRSIKGILTTITTALQTIEWGKVGQSIFDFIMAIDWEGIIIDVSKMINALWGAMVNFLNGMTDSNAGVAKVGFGIATVLAGIGLSKYLKGKLAGWALIIFERLATAIAGEEAGQLLVGSTLGQSLANAIRGGEAVSKILVGVKGAFTKLWGFVTQDVSLILGAGTAAEIAASVCTVLAAAIAGFAMGSAIGKAIAARGHNKEYYYNWKLTDLFTYSPVEWAKGIVQWITDAKGTIAERISRAFVRGLVLPLPISLALNIKDIVTNAKSGSSSSKTTTKADGGIYANGSWQKITKYASGGLPDRGQYFIAREKGPELVGTIGSHTGVVNNQQIVSSVSNGVASAVAEVMQPVMIQLVNAMSQTSESVSVEGLSDGDIVKIVKNSNNETLKRTGRYAF